MFCCFAHNSSNPFSILTSENNCASVLQVDSVCNLLQSCAWCTHNTRCIPENTDCTTDSVSWVKREGGAWSDPTGWSSGTVPEATDNVYINVYGGYVVTISTTEEVEVASITIGAECLRSPCHRFSTLRVHGSLTVTDEITIEDLGILELHDVARTLTVGAVVNKGTFNIIGPWTVTGTNAVTNYNLMQFTGGGYVNPRLVTFNMSIFDEAGGHLVWDSRFDSVDFQHNVTIQVGARFYVTSAERITGSSIINHGTTIFRAGGDFHLFVYSDFINTGSIVSDNQFTMYGSFIPLGGQINMHPGRLFQVSAMDATDTTSDNFAISATEVSFLEGTHSIKTSHLANCERLLIQSNSFVNVDNDEGAIENLYMYGGTLMLQNDLTVGTLNLRNGIINCQGHTITINHLHLIQFATWLTPQKEFVGCKIHIEHNAFSSAHRDVNFHLKDSSNFTVKEGAVFALRTSQILTVIDSDESNFMVRGELVVNGELLDVQPAFTSTGRIFLGGTGRLRLRKSVNLESGSVNTVDGTDLSFEQPGPYVINEDVTMVVEGELNFKTNVRMNIQSDSNLEGLIDIQSDAELILESPSGQSVTVNRLSVTGGGIVRADTLDSVVFREVILTHGKLYVNDKATIETLRFVGNSHSHYPELILSSENTAFADSTIEITNMFIQSSYRWAKIIGDIPGTAPTINVQENFVFQEGTNRNEYLEMENINMVSQGFTYLHRLARIQLTGDNSTLHFPENSQTLCRGGFLQMSGTEPENRVVTLEGSFTVELHPVSTVVPFVSTATSRIQVDSGTLSFSKSSSIEGNIHADGTMYFTGDQREAFTHTVSASSFTTGPGKVYQIHVYFGKKWRRKLTQLQLYRQCSCIDSSFILNLC